MFSSNFCAKFAVGIILISLICSCIVHWWFFTSVTFMRLNPFTLFSLALVEYSAQTTWFQCRLFLSVITTLTLWGVTCESSRNTVHGRVFVTKVPRVDRPCKLLSVWISSVKLYEHATALAQTLQHMGEWCCYSIRSRLTIVMFLPSAFMASLYQ